MCGPVAFDTLNFVEKPESGGFTHGQAKAAAKSLQTRRIKSSRRSAT